MSEAKTCEEVSTVVNDVPIRCGAPAVTLVQHNGRSEGPYWMCPPCADHNIRNRNARDITPEADKVPTPIIPTLPKSVPGKVTGGRKRKPGKYAAVVEGLPRKPLDGTASYLDKIGELKRAIANQGLDPGCNRHTPESLVRLYALARAEKERLTQELSDIQMSVTALEQLLIESRDKDEPGWGMYGASDDAVKIASGATFSVQDEPYGQIRDAEAYRLWCIREGLEQKLQLWPSTTAAIVKERCVAGAPPPDGIEVLSYPKVVWRKG